MTLTLHFKLSSVCCKSRFLFAVQLQQFYETFSNVWFFYERDFRRGQISKMRPIGETSLFWVNLFFHKCNENLFFAQEFIILNSVKIRFLEIYFKGWLAPNKFIEDNCDFLERFFSKRKFWNLQRVLKFLLNFIYFLFYGR